MTNQVWFIILLLNAAVGLSNGAYLQGDGAQYVQDFPQLMTRSYTAVDKEAPSQLLSSCAKTLKLSSPTGNVASVSSSTGIVSAAEVQAQCGTNATCIIDGPITLTMDSPLRVYSLIVRNGGQVRWDDTTQSVPHSWLCAGFVAIETGGSFNLNLQNLSKHAWIYIMNNGALHPMIRTRSFGAVGTNVTSDVQPVINIKGREFARTWSLLKQPLLNGSTTLTLQDSPFAMGWQVGDRIAVAPTMDRSQGEGEAFFITGIAVDGTISVDHASASYHDAQATFLGPTNNNPVSQSAEVINLSRNVVISGDDFEEIGCDSTLPEAVPGEQTSTLGCRCASFRQSCTVGLHTIQMNGGVSRIENTRVEKCGQRGIEGKYCLHFHQLKACPNCLFRNNAVEVSQQRGIIVHGTHQSMTQWNVLYDVRGASLYIEDGNEMLNALAYNVAICPWSRVNGAPGCSVPGTSNDQSDTSLNQAGIYMKAPTNDLIGNRMANHFNGMFLEAVGNGRGAAYGHVCPNRLPYGRWEGNTFHSSGRFGTYALNSNFPLRNTGQSVTMNGYTVTCSSYGPLGEDNGYSLAIRNNFDYGNAFVGHYGAGDIQYKHHTSRQNLNLIYWKETKSFADGCSAHISQSYFEKGTMALPDGIGSFIIEDSVIVNTLMEAKSSLSRGCYRDPVYASVHFSQCDIHKLRCK